MNTSLLGRRYRLVDDSTEGSYPFKIVGFDARPDHELEILGEVNTTHTLEWHGVGRIQLEPQVSI